MANPVRSPTIRPNTGVNATAAWKSISARSPADPTKRKGCARNRRAPRKARRNSYLLRKSRQIEFLLFAPIELPLGAGADAAAPIKLQRLEARQLGAQDDIRQRAVADRRKLDLPPGPVRQKMQLGLRVDHPHSRKE